MVATCWRAEQCGDGHECRTELSIFVSRSAVHCYCWSASTSGGGESLHRWRAAGAGAEERVAFRCEQRVGKGPSRLSERLWAAGQLIVVTALTLPSFETPNTSWWSSALYLPLSAELQQCARTKSCTYRCPGTEDVRGTGDQASGMQDIGGSAGRANVLMAQNHAP